MPVFISYSHEDKLFAQSLAANLVKHKASVWLDDWEVVAGESLIERIQSAIQGASALVVVLSKASVESVWCKKEVVAGIQRELEEKRILVIPALLEKCDAPLFLRDKKYADFQKNFDDGLAAILVAIAKFSNPTLGRIEKDEYLTDWSYDWFYVADLFYLKFTLVQHSKHWPYSVLSTIVITSSEQATQRYRNYEIANLSTIGHLVIVESVLMALENKEFFVVLEDNFPKRKEIDVWDPKLNLGYSLTLECRRLGEDTGRDILMHGADEIRKIRTMIANCIRPLTADEKSRLLEIAKKHGSVV